MPDEQEDQVLLDDCSPEEMDEEELNAWEEMMGEEA